MIKNEVMRLISRVQSFATTEVVLFFKLGRNEVLDIIIE